MFVRDSERLLSYPSMDTLGPSNNKPVGDRRAGPDASSIDWESFESRSRRDLESLLKEGQQVNQAIVQKLSRDIELFKKLLLMPEGISVSAHVLNLLSSMNESERKEAAKSIGETIAAKSKKREMSADETIFFDFGVQARSLLLRMWLTLRQEKDKQSQECHEDDEEKMGFSKRADFISQRGDIKFVSMVLGHAYQSSILGAQKKARMVIKNKGQKISDESAIGYEYFINLLFSFNEMRADARRTSLDERFSVRLWGDIKNYSAKPPRRKEIDKKFRKSIRFFKDGEERDLISETADQRGPKEEQQERDRQELDRKLSLIPKALDLYVEQARKQGHYEKALKRVNIVSDLWGLSEEANNKFGTIESIVKELGCTEHKAKKVRRDRILEAYGISSSWLRQIDDQLKKFVKKVIENSDRGPIGGSFADKDRIKVIAEALTELINKAHQSNQPDELRYVDIYLMSTGDPIKIKKSNERFVAVVASENEVSNRGRLQPEEIEEETGIKAKSVQRAINRVARHVESYQENLTKSQKSLTVDLDASQH